MMLMHLAGNPFGDEFKKGGHYDRNGEDGRTPNGGVQVI